MDTPTIIFSVIEVLSYLCAAWFLVLGLKRWLHMMKCATMSDTDISCLVAIGMLLLSCILLGLASLIFSDKGVGALLTVVLVLTLLIVVTLVLWRIKRLSFRIPVAKDEQLGRQKVKLIELVQGRVRGIDGASFIQLGNGNLEEAKDQVGWIRMLRASEVSALGSDPTTHPIAGFWNEDVNIFIYPDDQVIPA